MNKHLLFLFFFLLPAIHINILKAQKHEACITKTDTIGYLQVTGEVEYNNSPLEKSSITVYSNKKAIISIKSDKDGKFSFNLEFEKKFLIEVTKENMVKKKFIFNTYLPADAEKKAIYKFSFFKIVLFPAYKKINMKILKKPVAIINYAKKYEDFFYDYNYAKPINDKISKLQKEIEELPKRYIKIIHSADKYFCLKKYRKARKYYKNALEILPELYPADKIKEINKLLKNPKFF